jgi:hypothetical protein
MILRFAAVAAVLVGVGLFIFYLQWIGEGPTSTAADRHLREMKERRTAPVSYGAYTFHDFEVLPHGRPLAEFEALERRGVTLEGYTQFCSIASDGDYHLSLAETPPQSLFNHRTVTAEVTPEFTRGSTRWAWEPLAAQLRPLSWALPPWPGGPPRVRISGWLMYDFQYDAPFLPQKAPILPGPVHRRLTGWEIHPVTRIEIWDETRKDFVDYPR